MWFCGDAVDYLTRETDADFAGVLQRRVAEETIVKAAASSQTVALPVEGHARHDNQVDIGIVGEVLAGRLFDVEGALAHGGFRQVTSHYQLPALYNGQQNIFLPGPALDEGVGVHFIGQRVEQHDGAGFLKARLQLQFGQSLC